MSQTQIRIIQGNETFEVIKSAVNKAVDFVRPTYGPASNKVIISKILNKMVVDDGVQILRDLELPDPAENAVLNVLKEVSTKTNDRVGDGTTGAAIMVKAIINEVARKTKWDGRKIELELKKALEEVTAELRLQAKQITTKEELRKVAKVSFDDETISQMIADTYVKIGKDGIITVDKSPTLDTYVEMSDGITIDRGYISPYMVTNPERMETSLEKPYILVTDYRMTEANDILPIMDKMAKDNKRELVVIAENMEQSALATAIINKVQGKFLVVAINAPTKDDQSLEDIALMLGARFVSDAKGDKLENVEVKDLGRAARFICNKNESVIVGPKGKKADIATAISSLRTAITKEPNTKTKKQMEERLARFETTIAVIKVGAATENEQKALKYKVDDAVNATKAAYKHGVVCGAGLALARLQTSSTILNAALKYPARQLRENMGLDDELDLRENHVQNVVTGKVGTFMEVGVMDPVEVLIAGVESAVSIASVLLTSPGMIVETEKKPDIV